MTRGPRAGGGLPDVELRPQSVLLTFFGDYLDATDRAVASASVVSLLEQVGVGEHAARATLSRMVRRGLLQRVALGRRAAFALTPFGLATVRDGRARAVEERPDDGDGTWTLVSFSLPDEAQRERHALRAALTWSGFGMVQAGLWAAPRRVDVVAALGHLGLLDRVQAYEARPAPPTDAAGLVRQAFDLTGPATRYAEFVARWERVDTEAADPLVLRVVLATDRLQVLRADPRLPAEFLGPDWPGERARTVYRTLDARLRPAAERAASDRLEVVRLTG